MNRLPQTECGAKLVTDTYVVQGIEKYWVENTMLIAINYHFSRLESSDEKAAIEIIKL